MVSVQRSEPVVRLIDRSTELPAVIRADSRAFGATVDPEVLLARAEQFLELDRFWVADDEGDLVGHAGVFSFDMTLPGGVAIPTAGVTWVGVASTHRRHGLMRRLMEEALADARRRGESIAALYASEGGIYEHVGFGAASTDQTAVIDARSARLRASMVAPSGRCRWIDDADEVGALIAPIYERWRLRRPGQISRNSKF